MEDLVRKLAPYEQILGQAATIINLSQYIAGLWLLLEIKKIGESNDFSPAPIFGGLLVAVLGFKTNPLATDPAMFHLNMAGIVLNLIYLTVFYWYATGNYRADLIKKILLNAGYGLLGIVYAKYEDPKRVELRLGMFITGMLLVFVGAPLLKIRDVVKKRRIENGLALPYIISSTLISTVWTLYGLAAKNMAFAYQNMLVMFIGIAQLLLHMIYPAMSPAEIDVMPSTTDYLRKPPVSSRRKRGSRRKAKFEWDDFEN